MTLLTLVSFILLPINLVGNFLVVLASLLDRPHKACTYLLINLAIADLCFGMAYLLVAVLYETSLDSYNVVTLCKVYGYFTYTTVGVSVLTLAAISLERFNVIVKPLRHFGTGTNTTLKATVAIIWVGTNAIVLPMVIFISGEKWGAETFRCMIDDDAKDGRIYHPILGFILILCPFLCICYSYTRIIHCLWVKSEHNAMAGTNLAILRSRRKLTKLLVVVTAVFSICLLPMVVTRVMDVIRKEKDYFLLNRWTMVLMCVHSSVNPLIYSFNNDGFRHSIVKLFRRCGVLRGSVDIRDARVQAFATTLPRSSIQAGS